jgi:hypothetical protein
VLVVGAMMETGSRAVDEISRSLGIDGCAIIKDIDAMVVIKVSPVVAFIDIVVSAVGGLGGSSPPADG